MYNSRKIYALVMVFILLASVLIGCTEDGISLYSAANKTSNVEAYEKNTVISFEMDAENTPAKSEESIQEVLMMVNSAKLEVNEKVLQNKDKTASKQQIDMEMNLAGMNLDMSIWADTNLQGAKPIVKEVIKLPLVASMYVPELKGKQYVIMDFDSLMKSAELKDMDSSKILKLTKDLQPKLTAFIGEYIKTFKPGVEVITKQPDQTINNKVLSMYRLTLDDAAFKGLVKYLVADVAQNKDAINLLKEIINVTFDSVPKTKAEEKELKAELEKAFKEIDNGIPAFVEEFNKLMEAFKDVQIIGDKGITVDYGVDEQGYLVYEKGVVDIVVDTKALEDTIGKFSGMATNAVSSGIFKVSVNYESNTTNINNKDLKVVFPQMNSKNSINYVDLLKVFAPQEPVKPAKDVTPPGAPVVNKIKNNTTTITGKAEAGAVVTAKVGKTVLGTATVNAKGVYSIKIKKAQKIGVVVEVTAKDKAGNVSKITKVKVTK